jgi:hypothetical protein
MTDHDLILNWCRSFDGKREVNGTPVMRQPRDGTCAVLDVMPFDSPRLASGNDWTEVLTALRAKGYKL